MSLTLEHQVAPPGSGPPGSQQRVVLTPAFFTAARNDNKAPYFDNPLFTGDGGGQFLLEQCNVVATAVAENITRNFYAVVRKCLS